MKKWLFSLLFSFFLLLLSGLVHGQAQQEAMWLVTPQISPDGQQVAFCYRGVLYVVPVAGGEPRALTTGNSYAVSPVWSPDGQRIAYASDLYGNFDIYIVGVSGGQPVRVTQHSRSEIPQTFTPRGDSILFKASYMKSSRSGGFATGWTGSLYRVSVSGGAYDLHLPMPALHANYSPSGDAFLFEDVKGNEDPLRKHHTSSVTRDIWRYEPAIGKLTQVIKRPGEDRNPVYGADGDEFYFLSERNGGSFNVYRSRVSSPMSAQAVTDFEKNPVRYLSISRNGTLCFTYDGRIYTMNAGEGQKPQALSISISRPDDELPARDVTYRSGASDASISPDGKEVAYVVRGDVYVTSVKHKDTKRITSTPEQERSVDFAPDGRTLVYAGERDGSWNLYLARIARDDESRFSLCTEVKEEVLLQTSHETFQPLFSPDGKEVAFLEDRTKLKVINIATRAVRDITDGSQNYSYADGDLSFNWSPDGKWIVLDFNAKRRWPNTDIGLVRATGGEPIINLTLSGYTDVAPRFVMGGDAIIWMSDRNGLRSHASWGAQSDVYALFLTKEAFDKYNMTEFEIEESKKPDDKASKEDGEDAKGKKGKKDKPAAGAAKDIKIDLHNVEDRIVRLTIHSSDLSDAVVTPDGKYLYYLCSFEGKYDLWKTDLKKKTTKKVVNVNTGGGSLSLDAKGKNLLIASGWTMVVVELSGDKQTRVSYAAPFELRPKQEREYIFNHAWRQVVDKFYRSDLHGVDWTYYKQQYEKFLPHINNNYDFADLLSEMLGELNASHTGAGYRGNMSQTSSSTASLGLFFDLGYKGPGLKVTEVLRGGPFDLSDSKLKVGSIVTHIDGNELRDYGQLPELLDKKSGKRTRVAFTTGGVPNSEVVKPITQGQLNGMLYERWVEQRRSEVDSLSGGRLGYVHIRSMNNSSFHTIYSDLFGRYNDREGVVIDTRYNGGGHLHEDIEVLFSGEKYLAQVPREQVVGEQPRRRWKKPSVMLIAESNYSNAHGSPWVYRTRGIGKLVGQPVPGTMTSVWWETQIDNSLYFGVPIVGYVDSKGRYLENQQLEPDVYAPMDYLRLEQGHDSQIEKAVEVLLEEVDRVKAHDPWPAIEAKYR